ADPHGNDEAHRLPRLRPGDADVAGDVHVKREPAAGVRDPVRRGGSGSKEQRRQDGEEADHGAESTSPVRRGWEDRAVLPWRRPRHELLLLALVAVVALLPVYPSLQDDT